MSEIVHPHHPHILCSVTHGHLYTCSGCKEHGYGQSYQCKQEQCNYNLHRECATAAHSITHLFLAGHTYLLRYSPPPGKRWVCEACFGDVDGFGYYYEKKARSLHPCCAKLDPVLKTGVQGIELWLQGKISSKCRRCGVRKPQDRPGGWSYVSHCRNFNFHVGCIKDAMVESWSKAHMRNDGDDLALMGPSNGLVLYDDGGRPSWSLSGTMVAQIWHEGSRDTGRLPRHCSGVCYPLSLELNPAWKLFFSLLVYLIQKTEFKDLGSYNEGLCL